MTGNIITTVVDLLDYVIYIVATLLDDIFAILDSSGILNGIPLLPVLRSVTDILFAVIKLVQVLLGVLAPGGNKGLIEELNGVIGALVAVVGNVLGPVLSGGILQNITGLLSPVLGIVSGILDALGLGSILGIISI